MTDVITRSRDHIRRLTLISVARGFGFAALTVFTMMVGAAADLSLFLRTGAIGMLIVAAVLMLKAFRADRVPVKDTEVWLMIPKAERPPTHLAQIWIAAERKHVMLRFAYAAALIASAELALDLVLRALRGA
jgi:hypothetical protein